ncbi:hypothetical protein SARC_12419 [Sphaeroforma arctica JP610]|uniref:Uncharacterized protein n=1 Tax=Sphaeroforma arctica JP610 TaxID=667725 RepID=A0A0L0FE61_9EUKA|nr:hypothetical protein SARC_12419 [Sphaeroforma arctica JP610]KNC75049.1 hypothetical protein SARC_12419 [Sphaeroforma arctica JP610]|eukprot:XP_014148951.1 hypothetical protein SARC_12419 [Sphaeroforma arctica JP610]
MKKFLLATERECKRQDRNMEKEQRDADAAPKRKDAELAKFTKKAAPIVQAAAKVSLTEKQAKKVGKYTDDLCVSCQRYSSSMKENS